MKLDVLTDLEKSVIGGILSDPSALAQLDHLEPGHFHDPRARTVFAVMRDLEAAMRPIDSLTVEAELVRLDKSDAVGGFGYLGDCLYRVPTVANVIEYARRIRDASLLRSVRLIFDDVLRISEQVDADGAELLSMAHAAISKLDAGQPDDALPVGELWRRRLGQLDQVAKDRASGVRTMTGYPTGVAELDRQLGGWQSQIVSVIAARPAMGKSSLGLATADECSGAGFGVHLFNLEDTQAAYADRGLSRTSGVPAESMRNANLNAIQLADLTRAIAKTRKRPWLIDSRSGVTSEEIVRSVRKHRKSNGTKVVIVDYVQLVACNVRGSTHERLTHVITTLADAAKHDDIAYVVMSQLNREVERRDDKRPMMSDLRESGSLEERAKCVVAIYRGAYYSDEPEEGIDWHPQWGHGRHKRPSREEYESEVQLITLKNNNGATGSVWGHFHGPTTRMS